MTHWKQSDIDNLSNARQNNLPDKPLRIGIDPDITKSGIAILNRDNKQLTLLSLSFFELFDWLKSNSHQIGEVVIEAGWLISSNWHLSESQSSKVVAEIGRKTGENHATGKLIEQMMQNLSLPYRLQKPLKKVWGKTGNEKISHVEFIKHVCKFRGWDFKTTNPETRDAALIILNS